ncbi:lim homeobox protein awh-like protein [Lasius niger]|uniref:Lim homeobox protein awh-like protein n=1 Tax=Lasius niger TaxID=67767 RepID=A0A0J7NW56_LASNI|nr:lim homeobox protein awh-like protein [Lasius niger]
METDNNNNVAVVKKGSNDNGYDAIEMDCGGCGESVRERTVLCVGGRTWHSRCLKCCACARPLHDQHSCFLRGMRLYCRHDYAFNPGTPVPLTEGLTRQNRVRDLLGILNVALRFFIRDGMTVRDRATCPLVPRVRDYEVEVLSMSRIISGFGAPLMRFEIKSA